MRISQGWHSLLPLLEKGLKPEERGRQGILFIHDLLGEWLLLLLLCR